jgi:hypothetical protein
MTAICMHRGNCEPPVPSNVGKYMRTRTVATLREVHKVENRRMGGTAAEYDGEDEPGDDLHVCCHGRAAAEEVRSSHCCRLLGRWK